MTYVVIFFSIRTKFEMVHSIQKKKYSLHGSPQKNRVITCYCTNDKRKGTKFIFVIKEQERPTQGLLIIMADHP